MSDMWSKISAGAKDAGRRASVAAEKTKLQAEIQILQSKVTGAKKAMGVQIYDALSLGDQGEISRVFGQFKAQIDALEAQIKEKSDRIEVLDYR